MSIVHIPNLLLVSHVYAINNGSEIKKNSLNEQHSIFQMFLVWKLSCHQRAKTLYDSRNRTTHACDGWIRDGLVILLGVLSLVLDRIVYSTAIPHSQIIPFYFFSPTSAAHMFKLKILGTRYLVCAIMADILNELRSNGRRMFRLQWQAALKNLLCCGWRVHCH